MKKVLVLGGTGAMGRYLTPELLKMGYAVDVVALEDVESDIPALRYIKTNAMDDEVLRGLLENGYDAVVDFMVYYAPGTTFRNRIGLFLENTAHYINLSSYRVYADLEHPVRETSPRLLDAPPDADLLAEADWEYSIYKAVGEDMLAASGKKNWSIVRPAVTYSSFRFQLVTLEADVVIHRMKQGKTVVLPEEAMEKQGTMSWAGDVAKMIAGLVLNERAFGEAYTVSTAEHRTWREIAEYYREIGGLKYITVDKETYLNIIDPGSKMRRWQLEYDRLYDRIIDNSKILEITGLKQEELMPLKAGLKREYDALPEGYVWPESSTNERMDAYLAERGLM